MLLISDLNYEGLTPIQPIATATYNKDGCYWGLLLQSAAKGERFDSFIYRCRDQLEEENCDFEEEILKAQKAFKKLGQTLAQFQSVKSKETGTLPESATEKFEERWQELIQNHLALQAISARFPIEDLANFIEKVKKDALEAPIYYSYSHGDAHLGNIFYNAKEDRIYFIDTAKLDQSISYDGEPILDGIKDILRAEENLRRKALGILKDEDVERCIAALYEGYQEEAGDNLDPRLLLYYKVYVKLSRFTKYTSHLQEGDSDKKAADKATFDSVLDYFEKLL
jgi:aminoglycoside phosphotransferase (APT) family kinase protein